MHCAPRVCTLCYKTSRLPLACSYRLRSGRRTAPSTSACFMEAGFRTCHLRTAEVCGGKGGAGAERSATWVRWSHTCAVVRCVRACGPQHSRQHNATPSTHRFSSGTVLDSRHTAPATTGEATLVPLSERQPPPMREPCGVEGMGRGGYACQEPRNAHLARGIGSRSVEACVAGAAPDSMQPRHEQAGGTCTSRP